jgi:uncharacterized protein
MNDLIAIVEFVTTAIAHVLPVFLFSVFLGVLIQELRVDTIIREALAGRPSSAIFTATAIGAFSPFCSCTVIPVVNGLLRSGVPLPPVMAFWIASPLMDPEIFTMSVALLGWPLSIIRLGSTFILSLGAGFLTLILLRKSVLQSQILRKKMLTSGCCSASPSSEELSVSTPPTLEMMLGISSDSNTPSQACCEPLEEPSLISSRQPKNRWWNVIAENLKFLKWSQVFREVMTQSLPLGGLLILAFTLEALIDRYVPQAAIASFLGSSNLFSIPLAALVGIPLYLNNVTALPIIQGLLDKGMEPGAAIAFLIAGPVTTIPAMTAVWGVVQPRIFALYLSIGLLGAILLGLTTNVLLSQPLQAFVKVIAVLGISLLIFICLKKFMSQRFFPKKYFYLFEKFRGSRN